jgi:hypothetical protein
MSFEKWQQHRYKRKYYIQLSLYIFKYQYSNSTTILPHHINFFSMIFRSMALTTYKTSPHPANIYITNSTVSSWNGMTKLSQCTIRLSIIVHIWHSSKCVRFNNALQCYYLLLVPFCWITQKCNEWELEQNYKMLYNSNDLKMFWLKFMPLHSVHKILMAQDTV